MNNNQQQMQIDFSQTQEVSCGECKGIHFESVYLMRKLSALLSPAGEESLIPVSVFRCTECHHINKGFLPKELEENKENESV